MRVIIIGGTFNPVHIGHLWLVHEVKEQFNYDKVFFIPNHKPAHKKIASNITDVQRLDMLKLALEDFPYAHIETCEMYRGGVSYAIDTVRCLKSLYDLSEPPGLVLGDDLFESFHTWKDAKILSEEANLIVAHRLYRHSLKSDFKHQYLDNIIMDISSSFLRNRLEKGLAVEPLIPSKVINYINENSLYKKNN